jgi:S-adenosylmethionine:tRNA ribosyltransferase-isomerase
MLKDDQTLYNYTLPPELIAHEPRNPRDRSRLFVYDTQKDVTVLTTFASLLQFVPESSLFVFNETQVAPARITLNKKRGGKVSCLFLINEYTPKSQEVRVMVDRRVSEGDLLVYEEAPICSVVSHVEAGVFKVRLQIERSQLLDLLEKFGEMPLPPYLQAETTSPRDQRQVYQSVFADFSKSSSLIQERSVAAPTASLHFTPQLLEELAQRGHDRTFVRLEIGLGTFAPLRETQLVSQELHPEVFRVSERTHQTLKDAKRRAQWVIAVGTTVVRTVESLEMPKTRMLGDSLYETRVFITPGHKFKYVDALITNFHLPNSSLMMLVESFLQYKQARRRLVDLYEEAIAAKFRFYSYGDAMLIV